MNNDGLAKARATAEKLKAEVEEKEEQKEVMKAEVKSQLQKLKDDPELAEMYKRHAKTNADNLGGNIPYLRIHASNSMNELFDGTRPKEGQFYYSATKEAFDTVNCHILSISRGFRVKQTDKETGKEKLQYNQLIAGIIVAGERMLPFFMYANGLKLRPLWDFGKEMGNYTDAGYPMFSIVVEITTEEIKTEEYGYKRVPKYTIVRDENGNPDIILDKEQFNMFLRAAEKAKMRSDQIITNIEVQGEPQEITVAGTPEKPEHEDEPDPVPAPGAGDVIDPEDIPF